MNKNDFIKNVVQRHNLTEKDMEILTTDYSTVLEENTDFDDLFKVYLEEYTYNVAPKPAWFVQRAKKKTFQRSGAYEIRDFLVVLENGTPYQFAYEYPYETEIQAVEAIREKFKGKSYRLFRIKKKYETEKDNAGIEKGWLREKEEIF